MFGLLWWCYFESMPRQPHHDLIIIIRFSSRVVRTADMTRRLVLEVAYVPMAVWQCSMIDEGHSRTAKCHQKAFGSFVWTSRAQKMCPFRLGCLICLDNHVEPSGHAEIGTSNLHLDNRTSLFMVNAARLSIRNGCRSTKKHSVL